MILIVSGIKETVCELCLADRKSMRNGGEESIMLGEYLGGYDSRASTLHKISVFKLPAELSYPYWPEG